MNNFTLARLLAFCLALVLAACRAPVPSQPATSSVPRDARPPAVVWPAQVFNADKLAEMDRAVEAAIAAKKLPGGVLWLEHHGQVYQKAFGKRALVPAEEAMTRDTIFDAASVTKVMATTPAMLLLIERGKVQLDAPVEKYIPHFTGGGKENVTIRHLMTHTSGLRPGLGAGDWLGYDHAIELACAETLRTAPGTRFVYSDINFIVLGEVVRRVSGKPLNEFCEREIYLPLGMNDTGFLPPAKKLARIAPTTQEKNGVLRGVVHDPTSRKMFGVAGHAGLFTTVADTARYARMLLNGGELDGVRIFKSETVRLMTSVQSPPEVPTRRGLGWDIDSGYSGPRGKLFPIGSFGHTGWTGTSLWMDPFSQTILIFHSNRNHPTESGNVIALRAKLGTLAAEAIRDFNFQHVPGALPSRAAVEKPLQGGVLNGIDSLKQQNFAPLKNLRLGLITNHTGHDRERNATIDLLKAAPDVKLVALFSPEHGIRGAFDEKIGDSTDEKTGLPVFSLYGERRAPAAAQLENLDALVFDIQDIGCRFYTYPETLANCLEAAAKAKLKFFVLDRVNPINGTAIEGPVLTGATSFVAWHRVPLRHGMTVGEVAQMLNAERAFKADLTVIPVAGWFREMWFDQTALPWTNPSPNMRSLAEATLYPGIGLLESAVSVGRGTDTPFEIVGAPYVDDAKFAAELNRAGLAGVRFVPVRFMPKASVFKDKPCGGVNLLVTDRERFNAVDTGLTLALTLQRLYPNDFALEKMDTLLRDRATLDAIKAGKSLAEIKAAWADDLEDFKRRREAFLIYK
ncbi:MAG: DUF1343 domain-containing protein [Verrucomicrobia bacterium]|nr:DUF1343 domain-containing protein [Verrucomicrobiota bacterium]